MRKIKITLKCRVPSWNFCVHDVVTADGRRSKDLCRFCQKTKAGYVCLLHDKPLKADANFVYKTTDCIEATAGFVVTVDDPDVIQVDPKLIARTILNDYKKTLSSLLRQGYPQNLAEQIATQYTLGDVNK